MLVVKMRKSQSLTLGGFWLRFLKATVSEPLRQYVNNHCCSSFIEVAPACLQAS